MSHFTVMVVGDDHETMLAPYNEQDEQYFVKVDETEETKKDFEKYCDDDRTFEKFVEDWLGYPLEDGKAYSHHNPNAKWDWYQLGGRWSGFLHLKEGKTGTMGDRSWIYSAEDEIPENRVDQARKGDIDWEGMREAAGKRAAEFYDKADPKEPWKPWLEVYEQHKDDMDRAREIYHAQPGLIAVKENLERPFLSIDDLLVGRDAYIETAKNSAVSPYAMLDSEGWHQKGEMGWFGMGSNEMDQEDWNKIVWERIQALPDDAMISLVDCHI